MKVSKEVRKNAVDYSMNAITDICTNIGPRESGMPKEREAQEWIKNQIDTNGWADESAIEDFKVSRHALVGFTKIIGVFLIIGALLQLLTLVGNPALTLAVRIISLVLAVLSIVIVVLEFLFYVPFIDKFLPETTSCNVYAKYKPTGDVKTPYHHQRPHRQRVRMDAYEDKTGSHGRRTCSRFAVRARVDRHFFNQYRKRRYPALECDFRRMHRRCVHRTFLRLQL